MSAAWQTSGIMPQWSLLQPQMHTNFLTPPPSNNDNPTNGDTPYEDNNHFDLTQLEDDPMLAMSPSPPPSIIVTSLEDYPMLAPSPSPPPCIIESRAPQLDTDGLSAHSEDEHQDKDSVRSLAAAMDTAIDLNPSGGNDEMESQSRKKLQGKRVARSDKKQPGHASKSLNNPPIKRIQKIQKVCRNEVIDLTLEEVSFKVFLC